MTPVVGQAVISGKKEGRCFKINGVLEWAVCQFSAEKCFREPQAAISRQLWKGPSNTASKVDSIGKRPNWKEMSVPDSPNCNPCFNYFSVFRITRSSALQRKKEKKRGGQKRSRNLQTPSCFQITSKELIPIMVFFLWRILPRPITLTSSCWVGRTSSLSPVSKTIAVPVSVFFWLLKWNVLFPGNIYRCYLVWLQARSKVAGLSGFKEDNAGAG